MRYQAANDIFERLCWHELVFYINIWHWIDLCFVTIGYIHLRKFDDKDFMVIFNQLPAVKA